MSATAVAPAYEPPTLVWSGENATEQPWIAWVVFVFAYSAALAWASYCLYTGGSPDISWSWFKFRIACHK
jgi:hypothetical protein